MMVKVMGSCCLCCVGCRSRDGCCCVVQSVLNEDCGCECGCGMCDSCDVGCGFGRDHDRGDDCDFCCHDVRDDVCDLECGCDWWCDHVGQLACSRRHRFVLVYLPFHPLLLLRRGCQDTCGLASMIVKYNVVSIEYEIQKINKNNVCKFLRTTNPRMSSSVVSFGLKFRMVW